jgi:hypothetical protein
MLAALKGCGDSPPGGSNAKSPNWPSLVLSCQFDQYVKKAQRKEDAKEQGNAFASSFLCAFFTK